jgi:hypothetical protein
METKPLDARQLQEVCQEMQKQIYAAEREIRLLQVQLLEKQSYIDGISAVRHIIERKMEQVPK